MRTVILCPWRGGDPLRERLYNYVIPRWRKLGELYEGASPAGPFNRSAAINDAAQKAGDWDVAVIIDADTIVPPRQVRVAIQSAQQTGRMVCAYSRRYQLTEAATQQMLAGRRRDWTEQAEKKLWGSHSSANAITRRLWEDVRGFDPRFTGWGCEDTAFKFACTSLGGVMLRVEGMAFHLWHPTAANYESPEFLANAALRTRYRDAVKDREAMRALTREWTQ